jgi:predicted ATPase
LSNVYQFQGKMRHARALAEQMLRLAQRTGDLLSCQYAHNRLGRIALQRGEFADARTHGEQALALSPPPRVQSGVELAFDPEVNARYLLAWALWLLGYPDQARASAQAALVLAHERAHPWSLAAAFTVMAQIHGYCGAWHTVHEHAAALQQLATEQRLAAFVAYAMYFRGLAFLGQDQIAEGIAQLHQSIAAMQGTGERLDLYFQACLAAAYGRNGQVEEGLALLADVQAQAHTSEWRVYETRLYRFKGELLLARSAAHQAEAERCFQHAIDVSRQQQARSLELEASLSLSRLWQQQGRREAARQLLAEIYGWFTEGFDTADLQDARALLETLA